MHLPLDERHAIRHFVPKDAASIARHANDADVASNLRDVFPHPYGIEDAVAFIDHVLATDPITHYAITCDDEAVGAMGLRIGSDIFRRSAEIGYWIGREHWGKGIATLAVKALSTWAFDTFDLARLHAGVFVHNKASARVLEKAGYRYEGRARMAVTKLGRTFDDLIYAKVVEDD